MVLLSRPIVLAPFAVLLLCSAVAQPPQTPGVKSSSFPMFQVPPDPATTSIAKAPPPFVHPRLFFLSEDIPDLRKLLLDKASTKDWVVGSPYDAPIPGAGGFANIKDILLGTSWRGHTHLAPLFKSSSPYKNFFDLMLNDSTLPGSIDLSPQGQEKLNIELSGRNVAESGFGYTGVYGKLSGAAFVSLITQNESPFLAKDIAKVLGSTCRHHRTVWRKQDLREFGFFHDTAPDLGLAYGTSSLLDLEK
jgi:hypothetical protein